MKYKPNFFSMLAGSVTSEKADLQKLFWNEERDISFEL